MNSSENRRRAVPNRSGAQYARKRATHACLTCRLRKSKCDNQLPKCSFCVRSGSECNYPNDALHQLDRASLLILERLERTERTILEQLRGPQVRRPQGDLSPSGCLSRWTSSGSDNYPARGSLILINGDYAMTWTTLRRLLLESTMRAAPPGRD